jgi:hypothetical protein
MPLARRAPALDPPARDGTEAGSPCRSRTRARISTPAGQRRGLITAKLTYYSARLTSEVETSIPGRTASPPGPEGTD